MKKTPSERDQTGQGGQKGGSSTGPDISGTGSSSQGAGDTGGEKIEQTTHSIGPDKGSKGGMSGTDRFPGAPEGGETEAAPSLNPPEKEKNSSDGGRPESGSEKFPGAEEENRMEFQDQVISGDEASAEAPRSSPIIGTKGGATSDIGLTGGDVNEGGKTATDISPDVGAPDIGTKGGAARSSRSKKETER